MNQKKAKQLRRQATHLTGGVIPRSYTEGRKNVRLVPDGTDEHGIPKFKECEITGTVTLVKHCTRAVYKALKRAA